MEISEWCKEHVWLRYLLMSYVPAYDQTSKGWRVMKKKIKYISILRQLVCISPSERLLILYSLRHLPRSEEDSMLKEGFVYETPTMYLHIGPKTEFMFISF